MKTNGTRARILRAAAVGLWALIPLRAAAQDLFDLSIEELANTKITSVARKEQKASESAAAVFVLSNDDIRRSGATSIPEALRLVPGLDVVRLDTFRWAISARGFNDVFANKLLVLVDGRVVYTTLFSGVFWDAQDVLLEDVERIEVIRGPGASLWGANAVNGVVNIISKNSKETPGGAIEAGGGNKIRALGSARWGGVIDDTTTYRAYTKYIEREGHRSDEPLLPGSSGGAIHKQAGFRLDSLPADDDLLTLQGDLYANHLEHVLAVDPLFEPLLEDLPEQSDPDGANAVARWSRRFSATSDMQLQAYYDRMNADYSTSIQRTTTYDIDFQHRFALAPDHDFLWGGEYRHYHDNTVSSALIDFEPVSRSLQLYTAFLQDEISVAPDLLQLIVGAKFEHHFFTGFEFEPNIRAIWTPDDRSSVWAAVSRAARTPSRAERDVRFISAVLAPSDEVPLPTIIEAQGSSSYDSEYLYAYEAGYRLRPAENLSLDVAAFYNHYDQIISAQLLEPQLALEPAPHIRQPFTDRNQHRVESHGGELVLDFKPWRKWRIIGSYSYMHSALMRNGSSDPGIFSEQHKDAPQHSWLLRSLVDLPADTQFDAVLRFVDSTRVSDDYLELDVRLGWQPSRSLDLSLIGQDLLHTAHAEWSDMRLGQARASIQRGIYGRVTWRF